MKDILELIHTRRSCKSYRPDMPKAEDIDKVVTAGLEAASGRNLQGAKIVVITDKAVRDRLSAANALVLGSSADPFYGAPAVLVVLADKSVRTSVYDGSLVMGNMMLAAHALGLGSCWIHRAREVFDTPQWRKWLSEIGLEGEYEGVGNLTLGYPLGELPADKPRLPGRVFYV